MKPICPYCSAHTHEVRGDYQPNRFTRGATFVLKADGPIIRIVCQYGHFVGNRPVNTEAERVK